MAAARPPAVRARCRTGRRLAAIACAALCVPAAMGAAAVTGAASGGAAEAADETVRGLQGLRRVAVEIAFSPAHPGVPAEDAQGRIEDVVRGSLPTAPIIDGRSADRLRLTISVREVSSSELRGFYLPFSGSYGIGLVRLAAERSVTVPGVSAPVRAIVWQAERHARAAWRTSAAEILDIAQDLAEIFVEDYRRALAP